MIMFNKKGVVPIIASALFMPILFIIGLILLLWSGWAVAGGIFNHWYGWALLFVLFMWVIKRR